MQILEVQSSHLTNHEVLQHLSSSQRGPSLKSGNLETVVKELTDYLQTSPSPLSHPTTYTSTTISSLLTALEPYHLTKAELLMILNIRPQSLGVLDTIIEEMEERFTNNQDEEILKIIGDVLGHGKADGGFAQAGNGHEGDPSDDVGEH
ncbi:MAG: hypothetical protein M1833_002704 [Piccolia ochrophora]|nr:MAG: hypothetical protein M1833_002704 [Piccolia ochrophora]